MARLRLTLPPGMPLSEFTRDHPASSFHLLDRIPARDGQTYLVRFEVDHIDPTIVERSIYANPNVMEVLLSAAGPGRRTFIVRSVPPPYMPTVERFYVLRWLPITVREGIADWTILCPRAEWSAFIADLKTHVPRVDILAVGVHSLRDPTGPLTRRQAQAYRQAVLDGYYAVPRRVSLSQLAQRLNCSKSTLSEVLARAEAKMLRTDVVDTPPPVPADRTPARTPPRRAQA